MTTLPQCPPWALFGPLRISMQHLRCAESGLRSKVSAPTSFCTVLLIGLAASVFAMFPAAPITCALLMLLGLLVTRLPLCMRQHPLHLIPLVSEDLRTAIKLFVARVVQLVPVANRMVALIDLIRTGLLAQAPSVRHTMCLLTVHATPTLRLAVLVEKNISNKQIPKIFGFCLLEMFFSTKTARRSVGVA